MYSDIHYQEDIVKRNLSLDIPQKFELPTRLPGERENQCGPDGYQEVAAIQNEGSERVVNNEKSTTRIITKKHMAQAFCQGSQTTFSGARRAALTK